MGDAADGFRPDDRGGRPLSAFKPVYAVHCPFSGDAEPTFGAAWDLAWEWLEDHPRLRVERPDTAGGDGGTAVAGEGCDVRWRLLEDEDARLGEITAIQPTSDGRQWATLLWVGQEDGRASGTIRSGPIPQPGVIVPVVYKAGRPRVVESWLETLTVVRDGYRLTESRRLVGQNEVSALAEFVRSDRRQLPVVAVTVPDENSRPLVDDRFLGRQLAGLAHMVVIHPAASWSLRDALGAAYSVWGGAVRIWWPGFKTGAPPSRHRRWLPWHIEDEYRNAEAEIVASVWRAAVDAIGVPPLEERLRSAREQRLIAERIERLRHDVDVSDAWLDEYEHTLRELAERSSEVEELTAQIVDLRFELDHSADRDVAVDEVEVQSVEEAVRIAAEETHHVVFLDGAFASARSSQYPNPTQVLQNLRALIHVAERWAQGDLNGGFVGGFRDESVNYQRDISQTAKTKYRADYEIDFAGQRVLMGPHLRRGTGAPARILRIYWYVDDDTKQLIVGHVGCKLRDASNPG